MNGDRSKREQRRSGPLAGVQRLLLAATAAFLADLATSNVAAQQPLVEQQRLSDVWWPPPLTTYTPLGYYGQFVAVDGHWCAVVANSDPNVGNPSFHHGVLYIYKRSAERWVLHQAISTEFPLTANRLRECVLKGGDLFLVDYGEHAPALYSGRVFHYRLNNDQWTFVQAIQSPRPTRLLGFGNGLAVEEDRLLIGAPSDSLRGNQTGAVFEFERVGGIWVYRGNEFPLATGVWWEGMGGNLALCGDVAVTYIGRLGPQPSLAFQERVVGVFRRVQGSWVFERALTRPSPIAGDALFGVENALDVSEEWIVVGSTRDVHPFSQGPGNAYVFPRERNAHGAWDPPQTLQASNATFGPVSSDWFGGTVQLEGDRILVTAKFHGYTATTAERGAGYVFELEQGVWRERLQLSSRYALTGPSLGSRFGEHAAISGNVIVATDWSDPQTSVWGGPRGAAYVFELPLGETYCAPTSAPELTLTGVSRWPDCALTAEVAGAPPGGLCVVATALLAPSTPLPGPVGYGLCLASTPIRLATAATPVAGGTLRMPLWTFPAAAGGAAMAGTRWTFQAACSAPPGSQAPPFVASNGVVLELE